MDLEQAKAICNAFALKHKVIFDEEGEAGFGRECVGFRDGNHWIDHNPKTFPDYEPVVDLVCADCEPPDDVDAYHKHECLAVLGRGESAIVGLAKWVQKMESAGRVEIIHFDTGATGMQAILSGVRRRAVVVRK